MIDAVDVLTPYFRGSIKPDQKGGLLVRSPQSARPISSINPSIDSPSPKLRPLVGWLEPWPHGGQVLVPFSFPTVPITTRSVHHACPNKA